MTNESKAKELNLGKLDRVSAPYTAMFLRLQDAFGLRREESIKIQPGWADRGDVLTLKSTWTKGGKEREIPVRNETQRDLLNQAKALAGKGSLIPVEMSYKDQRNRFKAQTVFSGIGVGALGLGPLMAQMSSCLSPVRAQSCGPLLD